MWRRVRSLNLPQPQLALTLTSFRGCNLSTGVSAREQLFQNNKPEGWGMGGVVFQMQEPQPGGSWGPSGP